MLFHVMFYKITQLSDCLFKYKNMYCYIIINLFFSIRLFKITQKSMIFSIVFFTQS